MKTQYSLSKTIGWILFILCMPLIFVLGFGILILIGIILIIVVLYFLIITKLIDKKALDKIRIQEE